MGIWPRARIWRGCVKAARWLRTAAHWPLPRTTLSAVFLEIPQIRCCLFFLCWHEQAVRTQVVRLLANRDMGIVFGTNILTPPDRLVGDDAMIVPRDHPGPRQGIVNGGNLVMEQIGVCAVNKDALLDDGLVVAMERDAAGVIGARAL